MAYAIVNEFGEGTKAHYDATVDVVHPPGGLPIGQIHHYAGPSASGWVVIATWDSKEAWERLRDETLLPGLGGLGGSGFPGPPTITEFEIEAELTG
jgi:hypothetical protein